MADVVIGNCTLGSDKPLVLIGGPCQIESAEHAMFMAAELKKICTQINMPFIFKASFDKANRTSHNAPRGVGLKEAVKIFGDIKSALDLPILTDVHETWQCQQIAEAVDILQIPAMLSRQTDLIIAAAKTGRAVNIKKAQFMAPWDIKQAALKVSDSGNDRILLTERGSCFGYNTLVVDMRSLPQMAAMGHPVVFDATHSVQQPGGQGASSGGQREFVFPLARAAVAVGVAGVFMETHDNPEKALSDGPNMLPLSQMQDVLTELQKIDALVKNKQ
ncbi:MAG: 3-deoxy-8-phosphooctulonate synthase [Alphaproteobacteria bacterium]|nr:3-deoxy-8-phosphooctulonate synthase [Alphaproteobacteria bacterium]